MCAISVAAVAVIALLMTSTLTYAHISQEDDPSYLDLIVNITEYKRTAHTDFDLVQISLDITNRGSWSLNHPVFTLGGDSATAHNNSAHLPKAEYAPVSAEHIWNLNVPISPNDCAVADQWNDIPASSTGSIHLCFVVERSFLPNGLMAGGENGHGTEAGPCYSNGSGHHYQRVHYETEWPLCAIHVVPFREDSPYCDRYSKYCDRDNVQNIPEWIAVGAILEVQEDNVVEATPVPRSPANIYGNPLEPGTLFLASATILAFAVFGSALDMRMRRNPMDTSWKAGMWASISILVLVGAQGIFMLILARGGDAYSPWLFGSSIVDWWIFATVASSIFVLLFVTIGKAAPWGR